MKTRWRSFIRTMHNTAPKVFGLARRTTASYNCCMNRKTYLVDPDVHKFCNWFADMLIVRLPVLTQVGPGGVALTFHGLSDALKQYDWRFTVTVPGASTPVRGHKYIDNVGVLKTLATGLGGALGSKIDSDVRDWSIAVMRWGGVAPKNAAWLTAHMHGLHSHVTAHRAILAGDDDDLVILKTAVTRFNAGMSKVYSLILDQFIIYDSRVAGALASFVCEWCGTANIPRPLAFGCMPAKEGPSATRHKRRNPSTKFFPWIYNQPHVHAHWNLRATWVLAESLRLAKVKMRRNAFATSANPLRALEAALFMWGYDLPACAHSPATDKPTCAAVEKTLAPWPTSAVWRTDETRGGKRKQFRWRIDFTADRWIIKKADATVVQFSMSDIFRVIQQLYDEFGYDWVPLSNNVEKLKAGAETRGLGTVLYDGGVDVAHAQAASQLGVILERLQLLVWNRKLREIRWRLASEPPPTIEDLRMVLQ